MSILDNTPALGKTASITLITAIPGSGKTLRAVWYIKQAVDAGESVYVSNLNGLQVPHCEFPDPTKWQELPPGSLLVVDEAQQFFRRSTGAIPEYLTAMETIRHKGVRLLVITQQPDYLHKHLLGLVGLHEHLVRENGKEAARIYRHNEVMDNVRSEAARARYDSENWPYPKEVYALYKSAEVHTHKRVLASRTKRGIAILSVVAVMLLAAGYMAYANIIAPGLRASRGASSEGTSERASGEQAAPAAVAPASPVATANKSQMTPAEYLEQHQPRVPALPYSAPIFDDRHARADPQILCMSTGTQLDDDGVHLDGTCTCLTEQGTRYALELQQCRHIARFGPPYNPYRQSYEEKTSNVKLRDDGSQSFAASSAQPMPAASHGAVVGYSGDLPGGNPNL